MLEMDKLFSTSHLKIRNSIKFSVNLIYIYIPLLPVFTPLSSRSALLGYFYFCRCCCLGTCSSSGLHHPSEYSAVLRVNWSCTISALLVLKTGEIFLPMLPEQMIDIEIRIFIFELGHLIAASPRLTGLTVISRHPGILQLHVHVVQLLHVKRLDYKLHQCF